MMKTPLLYLTLGLSLLPQIGYTSEKIDHLIIGAGLTDIFESPSAAINFEYRYRDIYEGLRPAIGVIADENSGLYGYVGTYWEFNITERFLISPNFAFGLYNEGASEKLGGVIEFRSGIEFAYAMESVRIGASISHLSNGNIYDHNPGTEIALLSLHIPLGE